MMKKLVYGAVSLILAFIGVLLAVKLLGPLLVDKPAYIYYGAIALIGLVMAIVGVIIAPHLGKSFEKVTERIVAGFSAMAPAEIISRIIGLITGLIIASLSSNFLAQNRDHRSLYLYQLLRCFSSSSGMAGWRQGLLP